MYKQLATLSLLAVAAAQQVTSVPAPVIANNVPGKAYRATFDGKQGAGIKGTVTIASTDSGTGALYTVDLKNLPDQGAGGPFLYHVHVNRVGANFNCTAAGAHLDPQNRGEKPPCDAGDRSTCQVGDLAGKYGKMTASPWQAAYTDPYSSLTEGTGAFVGNRSIVIHDLNTTRIACANLEPVIVGNATATNGAPYPTGGSYGGSAQPSGAAAPTGSGSSGSGSGSGSGSSGSGSTGGSAATATPVTPKPSTSAVPASNNAASFGIATGALFFAAAAFVV